jgi:hypothetical protein
MAYEAPYLDAKYGEDDGDYWDWVYDSWSGGTRPDQFYKSSPGQGQTNDQLADFCKDYPRGASAPSAKSSGR